MTLPAAIAELPTQTAALHERLIAWSGLASGSTHPAGLARMAEALARACGTLTSDVALVPVGDGSRHAVRARVRPGAPRQVLCSGHFDTVYDAAHPFRACTWLDDGKLRGPGVADMKGGLVLMLAALEAFERTPHASQLGWEVLLTPDEEIGSTASRPLLEEAAPRHQLGLVFEPARETGALVGSRAGTGIFTVTCHGRAAHAGRDPAAGRNAVVALAGFIVAAARIPEELPAVMLNVGAVRGGGAANIVPDFAQVELNPRCTTLADAAACTARLHELAAPINAREGYRLEFSGGFNRPPMELHRVVAALQPAWAECTRAAGLPEPRWVHVGGGSDGNLLAAAGLPCLDGLGPVGGDLHSEREWVDAASLVPRAQVAALFLHRLAAGDIALP